MRILIPVILISLSAPALADLADEVRCREIGFSQSVEAANHEMFVSFIDKDARFVGDSVMRGSGVIAEAWSVFFAAGGPKIKWRPEIVEVLEDGNLALTRGPYLMTSEDENGNTVEQWGTFNSIWRLHPDGEWRVVFDAGSQASTAPPDEVMALLDQADTCAKASESASAVTGSE